jgi:hypothetical protein
VTSEERQNILRAVVRLVLDLCTDEVATINVHADVIDNLPYTRVDVWGFDDDKESLWDWSDFPIIEEAE